jgi:hypothetical protein
MFVVRGSFTLADGSQMQGYLTAPVYGDSSLSTLQPVIVTAHGQVAFWCGVISPSSVELAQSYRSLGRDANRIFPLQFESQVKLVDGPVRGTVAGFMVLEDMETGNFKTLT